MKNHFTASIDLIDTTNTTLYYERLDTTYIKCFIKTPKNIVTEVYISEGLVPKLINKIETCTIFSMEYPLGTMFFVNRIIDVSKKITLADLGIEEK